MNKRIIYPLLCIGIILFLLSCNKNFLEIVPQGNQVAVTTGDYDLLMNNSNFYIDKYGGVGLYEAQLMGDEAAASGTYFSQVNVYSSRLFRWDAVIYPEAEFTPQFLSNMVAYLYTFNKVINEVMNATDGTTNQKEMLRAEAKASRAWVNFQLVNYYAKPYLAATATTDPGFPVIEQADVTTVSYNRSTVQASYDFIIKDLKEAIEVLPVTPRIQTRFSKPAAEGLLGKVYLFMGRYSDALPLLNNAFADLASGKVHLYNYNETLAPGGAFMPVDATYGPAGPGNNFNDFTEDIISKIFYNNPQSSFSLSNAGLVLAPHAAALFDARDLRLKFYTGNGVDGSPDATGLLRKYGVTYSRYGLQLAELYLLRAECKARLNDLAGAVTDLESLRLNRMPADAVAVPAAVAGDQHALISFVIEERIREFALEGYRWFDMRRLSVDPLFAGTRFSHTLYNVDGTTTTYTLEQPNRLVLRIPPSFIISNPGMSNNP